MSTSSTNTLPDDVQRQLLAGRVVYYLPREKNVLWWCCGGLILSVGLLIASLSLEFHVISLYRGRAMGAAVVGVFIFPLGFFVREAIEVESRLITAKFLIGPFRFSRKRDLTSPDKLRVQQARDPETEQPIPGDLFLVFYDDLRLTGRYPEQWCNAVRADIERQIAGLRGTSPAPR